MNAYLVSHNGLGDNLYMVSALRLLSRFYSNKYYPNVHLFFTDTPQIECIPFDETDERSEIQRILGSVPQEDDIFVCGAAHTRYNASRITNIFYLKYQRTLEVSGHPYTIDYDQLTTANYNFIHGFYRDIGMNLTQFYEEFYLQKTEESIELYNTVKDYYVIFIQLRSSDGCQLNISRLLETYLYDSNAILICNDANLYSLVPSENRTPDIGQKREICQRFVYNPIVHYTETIRQANEIYIIDSCFTGIVLPYLKTGKLKASTVRIILRSNAANLVV